MGIDKFGRTDQSKLNNDYSSMNNKSKFIENEVNSLRSEFSETNSITNNNLILLQSIGKTLLDIEEQFKLINDKIQDIIKKSNKMKAKMEDLKDLNDLKDLKVLLPHLDNLKNLSNNTNNTNLEEFKYTIDKL